MAFAAGTIFEDWSTGNVANGGGFDPTNANFATDGTVDANTGNTSAPVFSSAQYTFVAGDVGAWLFIPAGANCFPGWYPIASVAGGKATLTAGIGTAVLYGTVVTTIGYQRPAGLNTVAGIASVGTPSSITWGIDYSQQAGAKIAYTDMVIGASTSTYTSVANPIGFNVVGNMINVTAGTGFTVQRVQVVSINIGTLVATVDKSLGTTLSTGGTGNLGGAVGSSSTVFAPTIAGKVAGNKIYAKATGTRTLTVTTTVTAAEKGDATGGRISLEGYTTYRGERDGRPVITSATNSVALFTLNDNDFWEFVHLKLTHTAVTRGHAFTLATSDSTPLFVASCVVDGCLSAMNLRAGSFYISGSEVMNTTSTTAAFIGTAAQSTVVYFFGCDIHDNAGDGVRITNACTVIADHTIFDTNAIGINGAGTTTSAVIAARGCVFVDNTSDGIKQANNSGTVTVELENNVFYNNGGYGIDNLTTQIAVEANVRINRNNAYGANSSGPMTGFSAGRGDITLTADPFTSRAGRDFSPNNVAGGGAAIRALAFPTAFPSLTTANYTDVGAVQHQDSASGAGTPFPVYKALLYQNDYQDLPY